MTVTDSPSSVNGIEQARKLLTAIPGPASIELQKRRTQAVSAGVGFTLPIFVERAGGAIIVDIDGNSLIDLASGIAVTNVGISAPEVIDGILEQAPKFTHTCFTVTQYEGYVEVCEALNRLTPGDHDKRSLLVNSGAEAVENAVKIARSYTKRQAVVVFEHSYHGRTNLTMGMTARVHPYKQSFGPFAPEIYRLPFSYPLHDGLSGDQAAALAISRMNKEIGATNIAAIVVEPIQGEGGFIVPATGFLRHLADYAKESGIVFVMDEIQSGFCRTGQWFASEHEGVVPDLITTAKGIAGGMPLAAVTGRAEIMDSVHAGGLGGTYGGNPVSCAAALGAIKAMESQDLNAKAKHIESVMRPRLEHIATQYGLISEVRGRGAMIAVEIVDHTGNMSAELTGAIAKACHKEGVVVLTAGTYGNVLRFLPPLTISDELLNDALDVIEKQFAAVTA